MSIGQPGRRIIALACQISLRNIRQRINDEARQRAYAKLAELMDERDREAKDSLLRDRAVMNPVKQLYAECPPATRMEIVHDTASFFGLTERQAEALLYSPARQQAAGKPDLPAIRPLQDGDL